VGANKIKEKLGIKCLGQEPLKLDIIREGAVANVYKLDREALNAILNK